MERRNFVSIWHRLRLYKTRLYLGDGGGNVEARNNGFSEADDCDDDDDDADDAIESS